MGNVESHDSYQEPTATENQGIIPNGDKEYTARVRAVKPNYTIGLEAAWLLPSSFNIEKQ